VLPFCVYRPGNQHMTYFFGGVDAIMGHRTARQRERVSHTLHRLCEARNEAAMQDVGGGSADTTPAPRAPRTRRTTRKPAGSGDADGDGPAPRSHAPQRFYDLPTVAHVVSLSTGNVQKLVREGSFPKPRELSARRVAWLAREVDEWCESRPVAEMLPPVNAGMRKRVAA
jgi:prophage regulatory protein